MPKRKETVMVICAHNDDQTIGIGGTLAKYVKEGKRIVTIIMSFGEIGVSQYDTIEGRKIRVKEAKRADKVIGIERTHFLGLTEGKFTEEIEQKKLHEKILKIIKEEKPKKIFTHADDDPHPDHKATYQFVMELADLLNYEGDIYSFNIWNFFINFKKKNRPKMVVDVSDTFKLKIDAFKKHRSQFLVIWSLLWNVYFQAIINGLKYNAKYVEIFYKLR